MSISELTRMAIFGLPRSQGLAAAVALAMTSATGGAHAMDQLKGQTVVCNVVGGEKLLANAGGSAGLCELIKRAAAAEAPGVRFTVEIQAPSTHTLAAKIRLSDGRFLPDLNLSISDRLMDRNSVERFASAIAGQVAEASSS